MKKVQKPKILFRHQSLAMGGVEKVMLQILRNLNKEKYDITLLLDINQGPLRDQVPEGVTFKSIGKGREDMSSNPLIQWLQLVIRGLKLKFYTVFPNLLYRWVLGSRYSVELSSTYTDFQRVLGSPDQKSKKVTWFHTDIRQKVNETPEEVIQNLNRFDRIIFGSKQTRDIISEEHGTTFDQGVVIYNPIDYSEIIDKANAFNVHYPQKNVFIGVARLAVRKGFDRLIKAAHQLIQEEYEVHVIIIGDGPERNNLEALIQDLNMQDHVEMLGIKKNPYPYIKAADCYVLSSWSESFPLIVLETCSLGKPIIACDSGGVNEIIRNEENGLLIESSTEAIYTAMKRFLDDNALRTRLSMDYNRPMPREFQLDNIMKSVERVIDELIQQP